MVGMGLVIGLLIGLTGIGGGSLATPMLILSGMSPATAVGTSLAFSFVTKLSGSVSFVRRKLVHFEIARDLSIGCLPGTLVGAFVIRYLGLRRPETLDAFMTRAIGTVLIVVAVLMLLRLLPGRVRPKLVDRTMPVASWQRSLAIAAVGFGVGMVVTITSIGSAAALIPVMVLFYRLDSGTLVGTNVFMGTIMAGIAMIPHAGLGHLDWMGALGLACGSVPGVWLTSRWHGHIPRQIPEGIIAVALLAMGLRIVSQ